MFSNLLSYDDTSFLAYTVQTELAQFVSCPDLPILIPCARELMVTLNPTLAGHWNLFKAILPFLSHPQWLLPPPSAPPPSSSPAGHFHLRVVSNRASSSATSVRNTYRASSRGRAFPGDVATWIREVFVSSFLAGLGRQTEAAAKDQHEEIVG